MSDNLIQLRTSGEKPLAFPHVIDSTMLQDFACEERFKWQHIERIKPVGESVHLIAGGAFAKGLATARIDYYQNHNPRSAAELRGLEALIKAYGPYDPLPDDIASRRAKCLDNVIAAYLEYFDKWPMDQDPLQVATYYGKPAVEYNFAIPSLVNHPVTNQPILIAGTLDWIGNMDGVLFAVDEKTTGYERLPHQGHSLWVMRAQFMCYAYAAKDCGFDVKGVMIREVVMHLTDIKLNMAIVYPDQWRLDRWWQWANHRIQRMVDCYLSGEYELNMGNECTNFGGCPYLKLCAISNPHDWKTVGYEENTWNPLARK